MTIQAESKQLYSLAKKNSSVFVRQKAKLRKSRTQKVGKSESEVQSRTVDAPERKKAVFYYPGQLILYRGEDDDSVKK